MPIVHVKWSSFPLLAKPIASVSWCPLLMLNEAHSQCWQSLLQVLADAHCQLAVAHCQYWLRPIACFGRCILPVLADTYVQWNLLPLLADAHYWCWLMPIASVGWYPLPVLADAHCQCWLVYSVCAGWCPLPVLADAHWQYFMYWLKSFASVLWSLL